MPSLSPTRTYNELIDGYQQHAKSLTQRCYFKVNNRALAEDLVQETFMKTWMYIQHSGSGTIESMKAFLFHVLNNLIVDEYRKRKSISLDALAENGFEPGLDDSSRLLDRIDGTRAAALIDELPAKYRTAVSLRYQHEMSLSEMAAQTKQSKNAVTVQVYRGLGKLKKLYTHKN